MALQGNPTVTYARQADYQNRGPSTNTETGTRGNESDGDSGTYWGGHIETPRDNDFRNTQSVILTYEYPGPVTLRGINYRIWMNSIWSNNNYEGNAIAMCLKVMDPSNNISTIVRYSTPDYGTAVDSWTGLTYIAQRSNRTTRNYDSGYVQDTTIRTNVKKVIVSMFGDNSGDDNGGSDLRIYECIPLLADDGYGAML